MRCLGHWSRSGCGSNPSLMFNVSHHTVDARPKLHTLDTAFADTTAVPVFRVIATIGPFRSVRTTVRQGREGLVVGQIDGERAS
jgi:hypothetical protein